jgi:hypothetical protein
MRTQSCTFVVAFVILMAGTASGQTIPELVRANPDRPVVRRMHQDVRPVPLETLLRDSPVVLIARVHFSRSYLTPDESYILSDFVIRPEQVLAGALPVTQSAPGQTKEPILTMYGGEIRVEGKKASAEMLNMKPLNSGQRFLLFLQPYGTDVGRYKAAYGAIFEIQDDRMRSLLSMSGGDPFPDLTSRSLGDAMKEIARWRR